MSWNYERMILQEVEKNPQITQAEIALRLNCSNQAVSRVMRRNGYKRKEEKMANEFEILNELQKNPQITQHEIAVRLNCSNQTVSRVMKRNGIKRGEEKAARQSQKSREAFVIWQLENSR